MGLWQTGYLEFHEWSGLNEDYSPPKPVYTRCSQCEKEFLDVVGLSRHRFEAHPYHQPILVIGDTEFVSSRHTISKKIETSNIHFLNASNCWLNDIEVPISVLAEKIATIRRGYISVRLRNNIGQIDTAYELDFDIPEKNDIIEVDKRFFEFSSMGNLNVLSINAFIEIANKFPSTRKYVDGLSSYLYAVLAKDGRGDTTLSKEQGRARLTHAIQILSGFDTSLSKVISEIINLNLNAFNTGSNLLTAPLLAKVMRKFWALLHPDDVFPALASNSNDIGFKQIPIDICTSQIIEWSLLSADRIVEQKKILEKALLDDNWVPDDRVKVHIILANAFFIEGDITGCLVHARRIRHNPFLGEWAESLIKTTN
jgi:hypothetical protein